MSRNKIGEVSPIPKFMYLKIRRRNGVESLTTLEEGEFTVPIDGCIKWTHCSETVRRRFYRSKKRWRSSLDRISKVYRYWHQKTKLKIKFHLYIGDSGHQNIKKYVTWELKSQKFYVLFPCNPMEPLISAVGPVTVAYVGVAKLNCFT